MADSVSSLLSAASSTSDPLCRDLLRLCRRLADPSDPERLRLASQVCSPNDAAEISAGAVEESAIEDAVEWFRKGGFLVVVDAADRENEGDLVIAAEDAGPEQIAFMIRNTSGLICAPMTAERAHCLNLPLMVPPLQNTEAHGTAFTVSVDVREGVTTGISAEDRSTTIRALASENTKAVDLVRPGHIFPLVAKAGGVLERPGHTEAAVDLCKMAGKFPVAAISEITLPDGSMARTTDLIRFSKAHGLPFISIEQIIGHRRKAHQPQPSELPT